VSHAAVFLDRDGVINELAPDPDTGTLESPYRPEDVRLLPGVERSLEELAGGGFTLVVASNQPAAAKGLVARSDLDAVHERVVELLGASADTIAAWRYCFHHPDALDAKLRDCDCRKPKPGLLLDAARDLDLDLERSWVVGDADRDVAAGIAAGCRTILVEHPASARRRTGSIAPDLQVFDLPAATGAILSSSR
jgi:D-glycero-D-manno-heptose 1,7-bisphosphate phosphatase